MESDPFLLLDAPAKINLGLEVLRRRPDGYHDINTLFAAIDLFDRITLRPRKDSAILCTVPSHPRLETDPANLCVRAANLLRERAGRDVEGLDIRLEKHIPIGAGLGGGSSDAAAVLRGAARLWGMDLQAKSGEWTELASRLGSDVPFFLLGGMALGTSRGEVLAPVDLSLPFHLLLLLPGIHVATPWAYKSVGRTGERPASDLIASLRNGIADPSMLRGSLVNDFEAPVFAAHPLLGELKERLYRAGALYASMSGSGSTLFGLFHDRKEALHAASAFKNIRSVVARFLPAV